MPSMANITVKKADGTTDIVYTAMQPSSGDKTEAIWRCEAVGVIPGNRPLLKVKARPSANGQFRLIDLSLSYPETFVDANTGLTKVKDRDLFTGTWAASQQLSDTATAEFAAQAANLITSALIKSVVLTGFAPS